MTSQILKFSRTILLKTDPFFSKKWLRKTTSHVKDKSKIFQDVGVSLSKSTMTFMNVNTDNLKGASNQLKARLDFASKHLKEHSSGKKYLVR